MRRLLTANRSIPSKVTVAEFLDRWERDWATSNVGPKTLERYVELMKLHVRPRIGAKRLQKLSVAISVIFTQHYSAKAVAPPKGLLPVQSDTFIGCFMVRSSARWIGVSCSGTLQAVYPLPRVNDTEVEILSADQVHAVLRTAKGKPIYQIATLALNRDATRRAFGRAVARHRFRRREDHRGPIIGTDQGWRNAVQAA